MADTKNKIPIIAGGIVVLLIIFTMCQYTVRKSQVAVVTTFAQPKVVVDTGLKARLPWPIQKVTFISTKKQLLVGQTKETSTRDKQNIVIDSFMTWQVDDFLKFYNNVGTFLEAESLLKSLLESKQETVIRRYPLSDFTSSKEGRSTLETIENEILELVKSQASDSYGIAVTFVGFSQINVHESNSESILERMRQEQVKQASKILSQGMKEAKIIGDNATSKRKQLIAKAEAEAKKIRADAVITATQQYDVFAKDVEFAIFLRNLDALEDMMKNKTTIILDPSIPPFNLLKSSTPETPSEKK